MRRALKVLDPSAMPNARERFVREAEILFELDHPSVVDVVDLALEHDPPYLVMELIDGESLEHRLKRGPLPIAQATRLFSSMASALSHAHARGIHHRDIKPSNIMLTENLPKLVDFGIAVQEDRTQLTKAGTKFGSMSYTPPELFDQPQADNQLRDVYGLGVVLYESLVGAKAFPEPQGVPLHVGWAQLQMKKSRGGALDPGPGFPTSLRDLIRQSTEPEPDRRMPGMGDFLAKLDNVYANMTADDEQVVMMSSDELANTMRMGDGVAAHLRKKPAGRDRPIAISPIMVVFGLITIFAVLMLSGTVGGLLAWLLLG
jgi:serine/threonine protein kinase